MSLRYTLSNKILHFKQPAGTSRGVYTTRKIWLVELSEGDKTGLGECAPLPDLSCDAMGDERYMALLNQFCQKLCETGEIEYDAMRDYPSMLFGLETALLSLKNSQLSTLNSCSILPLAEAKSVSPLMVLFGWAITRRCSSGWRIN